MPTQKLKSQSSTIYIEITNLEKQKIEDIRYYGNVKKHNKTNKKFLYNGKCKIEGSNIGQFAIFANSTHDLMFQIKQNIIRNTKGLGIE